MKRAAARVVFHLDLEAGRLGHGKIELLEAIAKSGSLAAAARTMGMSYKRAWELLGATNRLFTEPVAVSLPGRNVAGSTALTPFGERVVALYRAIERRATQASAAAVAEINAASRPRPSTHHSQRLKRA